jgi:hypothetical protein
MTFDLGSMELRDDELPRISDKEPVPLELLNFVQEKALGFLAHVEEQITARRSSLPEQMVNTLEFQIQEVRRRINGVRSFAIHKILKYKYRQTLIEHRLEEWMIYSIKTRNEMIYELACKLKDLVKDGQPDLEEMVKWQPYQPLLHKAPVNFELGPEHFKLTAPFFSSSKFFSPGQLWAVFTDLRNLCTSTVKDEISVLDEEDQDEESSNVVAEQVLQPISVHQSTTHGLDLTTLEKFTLQEVVQLFRYRVKNNNLGPVPLLPEEWAQFKHKKLVAMFTPLIDNYELIYFAHIALIFTLLRYPMPTIAELARFEQGLDNIASMHDFAMLLCWLDEYDEISCPVDVNKDTEFATAKTKEIVYWIFSYRTGELDKALLMHFMKRYISPQPMERYYSDILDLGH